MKCPYCGYKEDKVIDSRSSSGGNSIRRRRECLKCERRFTTYEYIEQIPLLVVKKAGQREPFDRTKILSGIIKACEKRPVSMQKMEDMVTSIERIVMRKYEKEIPSTIVGELIMEKLAEIDDVAYVRFASVYRQFKDVNQFMKELQEILGKGAYKKLPKAKKKKR
ncbi:MAG: transcriptional regulator NrdR [Omnitrophica WOR_2 bacterium GWF2_43_52]|nr:MAG: transcriptional regulator NrdR [Omnitrophica WOR_2 bacterium GWA2_44_7]OGX22721.1 MAG: transcriptional regulator NrdR [Omnitrophica WOR_2 bacterium GWF2_43_52]HAH20240.1 transcriptional regulator NrdR [Candidatus Omnitrophota bacterium]HBG63356.1 transcriptional regulator NrdR [Candidatus Omnitrophota bacterium]